MLDYYQGLLLQTSYDWPASYWPAKKVMFIWPFSRCASGWILVDLGRGERPSAAGAICAGVHRSAMTFFRWRAAAR
jgi:hypothetical protein